MSVRPLIRQIIDDLAERGERTSPAAVERLVAELHDDAVQQYAMSLARQRVRAIAREMLTSDNRNGQQALNDMDLPRWVTNPDGEGDHIHIPLRVATLAEYETYIEQVLRRNVDAARDELRRHQRQWRKLNNLGLPPTTRILDAVEGLS